MSSIATIPAGTPVVVGQNVVPMPAVKPTDRVVPVVRTGELVVISEEAYEAARAAVDEAAAAVEALAGAPSSAVDAFFLGFAERLADDAAWAHVAQANAEDVASAEARGRSTTRLVATPKMRADMIAGLRNWASTPSRVGEVIERRERQGYVIERRRAPLGVVAFVFEGRPNVFADGAGVVRNGNAAVMRIGADALGTALAIEAHALRPALLAAGLPEGAVRLVRHKAHGAGQALFTLPRVRLAVARGSGATVALLGAIAEQHGIPASLHGTGGAWMFVEQSADPEALEGAIVNSLDRKVCNTLNVLLLERAARGSLGPVVERALRKVGAKVHVVAGSEGVVTGEEGFPEGGLGTEWEWERVPEVSFLLVDDLKEAARRFNTSSPRFVASIVSTRPGAFEELYAAVDAPYVSNGFTRWVDGQWAYDRPELGLTNWEGGRLLGRSGFLSGDDIVSVRDVFLDRTGKAVQRR
ncbi:aldehyde dehydrogenase family protein [Sorangium sp. So ce1182]|uniref:aldehyde dehydrogenase family protein n=1 Tax=Sorangium sp. So ce1182 TaxID=3133334 RepID=UPI003F5EBAFD